MKRIILLLIATLAFLASCTGGDNGGRNHVTVSIAPLGWAVQQIADTLLQVDVLVPDASSAESFEPTSKQIVNLSRSDIYFSTGLLDFEKATKDNVSAITDRLKVVELKNAVDVMENGHHHDESGDPHIWLSVKNMRRITRMIKDELVSSYPAFKDEFTRRYDSLDGVLLKMDADFAQRLDAKAKVLIVHPSLSYLARDYSFSQIAVEYEGKEPSASYLKSIFDTISSENIKTIFYSLQDNPAEAKVIASEAGINAVEYDPLSHDWMKELYVLVDNICRK